jgi:hypothetical protein
METAEAYCMGTLNAADATRFEDHYITCRRCAAIVEDAGLYVRAMQDAARLRESRRKTRAAGSAAGW